MRNHHARARQLAKTYSETLSRAEAAGCEATWRATLSAYADELGRELRRAGITLRIVLAPFAELTQAVQAEADDIGDDLNTNVIGFYSDERRVAVVAPSLNSEAELSAAFAAARMVPHAA